MNSSLHCATNRMILGNSLVSQGLSFHIYKIKARKVPVNNQYKLPIPRILLHWFLCYRSAELYVQKGIDVIRVASSQDIVNSM